MRLLVIGCGQCGGRIADEFARLNERAHKERGINIITDCFAVNTDMSDLSGLLTIRHDHQHRLVIGGGKTDGHGVGKINELGAEIAKNDGDKLLRVLRETEGISQPDAFLLAASAGGGTGSGTIGVLTKYIKMTYPEKPVYDLIVLPFKHEEATEGRVVYNVGTCLKSAFLVADAVFLVDNERFVKDDSSLRTNLHEINSLVVEPFYNLLCAGEEKKPQYVGSRVLDAGDIMQTLSGWSAIGYGTVHRPTFDNQNGNRDFQKKEAQAHEEIQAMNAALRNLSLKCNPTDARRALYLLCAPPEEMNMVLIEELGNALKKIAKDAVIRRGDYPRVKHSMEVTIVLSELRHVARITDFFNGVIAYVAAREKQEGIEPEHQQLEDAFKDIPMLF